MGNLIFLLTFLFSVLAHAQDVNLLKNGDFESRLSRWSKTGSSTLAVQSGAPLEGSYSADWDASATGEFLRSNTYTITEGLKGRRCTIEMEYLWDSGVSGEILMNVDDGTNNVASIELSPTSGGISAKSSQTFECPSSGSLRFELESTADAASIRVDKMYLGSGKNTVEISQAVFAGESYIQSTASCVWSRTSTTIGAFAAVAACPAPTVVTSTVGNWLTTDSDLPRQTIQNLPSGKYLATFNVPQAVGIITGSALSITDGTTTCEPGKGNDNNAATVGIDVTCSFTYNSAQNSITFELLAASASGTLSINNQATAPRSSLKFRLQRFPLASAEALTLETSGSSWSGYHATDCNWTTTSATYVDPTSDASCTFTEITNRGFGTVVSTGANQPGITFTPKIAGTYNVCATAQSKTSSGFPKVSLNDGAIILSEASVNNANSIPQTLCGLVTVSSISSKTVKLQIANSGGGTHTLGSDATPAIRSVSWSIFPISQQFPPPVFTELQNLVKSSNQAQIEYVSFGGATEGTTVCAASPCTMYRNSSGVTSVTRNSSGNYTVNFSSGTFTSQMVCYGVASSSGIGPFVVRPSTAAGPTNTTWNFTTTRSSTEAVGDTYVMATCIGTK